MNEKPIYTQKAPGKNRPGLRIALFVLCIAIVCVLLFVASNLPYSGISTLVIILLCSLAANAIMKKTMFDITYTLYEDKLVFMRKYGRLSWENETFYLNEAKFFEDKIMVGKSSYEFHPDDKLKELLGIEKN